MEEERLRDYFKNQISLLNDRAEAVNSISWNGNIEAPIKFGELTEYMRGLLEKIDEVLINLQRHAKQAVDEQQ